MNELEILLSCLRDADATAAAAAISNPQRSKAIEALQLQLAAVIEAAEALAETR